jgi:hypothetical protein
VEADLDDVWVCKMNKWVPNASCADPEDEEEIDVVPPVVSPELVVSDISYVGVSCSFKLIFIDI